VSDVREHLAEGHAFAGIPAFAIDRPVLMERLDAGVDGNVTSLVAPAGFGKSLLLGQWMRDRAHLPLAWLPLDRRDDYGRRVANRLVAALCTVHGDVGELALERIDSTGQAMGDHFIAQLLGDLELAGPYVLVVDGIDQLGNERIVDDLRALVEHSSSDFRVVLATRAPGPRWRSAAEPSSSAATTWPSTGTRPPCCWGGSPAARSPTARSTTSMPGPRGGRPPSSWPRSPCATIRMPTASSNGSAETAGSSAAT
jgi:hypothetical protein